MDTTIRRDEFEELWLKSSPKEIAKQYEVSRMRVYHIAKTFGLKPRSQVVLESDEGAPSESEILERAAAIREKWSDEEERKRRVGNRGTGRKWTAPEIKVGEIEAPSFSRI